MGFCSEAAIGGSRECNESEPMVCYMVNSESGTGDSIRANKKLSLTRMCLCPCPINIISETVVENIFRAQAGDSGARDWG